MARILRVTLGVLSGGALLIALGVGLFVYPWVRDDVVLDRVVQAVALDWRDFGEEQAMVRLQYELDHQGIGMQVEDGDCALEHGSDGLREVRCDWGVAIAVPGTEHHLPLRFSSYAAVSSNGDLL